MALARKQQKLLGFGTRLQCADSVTMVRRELEVRRALDSLDEVYRQQRQLQAGEAAECTAVLDLAKGCAVLMRRRGHAVESFGRREDGEWVLHLAEVLYLAERGTLAVHKAPDSAGEVQPLSLAQLYSLILGPRLRLQEYLVFAHLRRAGCAVDCAQRAAGDGASRAALAGSEFSEVARKSSTSAEWMVLGPETVERRPCCWEARQPGGQQTEAQSSSVHVVDPEDEVHQILRGFCMCPAQQPMVVALADSSGCNPTFVCLEAPRRPCRLPPQSAALEQVRDAGVCEVDGEEDGSLSSDYEARSAYAVLRKRQVHLTGAGDGSQLWKRRPNTAGGFEDFLA